MLRPAEIREPGTVPNGVANRFRKFCSTIYICLLSDPPPWEQRLSLLVHSTIIASNTYTIQTRATGVAGGEAPRGGPGAEPPEGRNYTFLIFKTQHTHTYTQNKNTDTEIQTQMHTLKYRSTRLDTNTDTLAHLHRYSHTATDSFTPYTDTATQQ